MEPPSFEFTSFSFIAYSADRYCGPRIEQARDKWNTLLGQLKKGDPSLCKEYMQSMSDVLDAAQDLVFLENMDNPLQPSDLDQLIYLADICVSSDTEEFIGCPIDRLLEKKKQCLELIYDILGFCFELSDEEEKHRIRGKANLEERRTDSGRSYSGTKQPATKVLDHSDLTDFPRVVCPKDPPGISKWRKLQMEDRARRIKEASAKLLPELRKVVDSSRSWLSEGEPLMQDKLLETARTSLKDLETLRNLQVRSVEEQLKRGEAVEMMIGPMSAELKNPGPNLTGLCEANHYCL